MKSNSLTAILLGVLAISTLASVVLTMVHTTNARELRALQQQVARVNQNRNYASVMVQELLEYSKRNPSIDPVLESVGLKNRGGSSNRPAAK